MDKMENFESVQLSNGKVLMDLWDYNDMIRKCYMLSIIKDMLYDSAILIFQKGALRFDDGIVSAFIMKCWNKGEKNAYQIAQETGISYKTVRNYIPINKED